MDTQEKFCIGFKDTRKRWFWIFFIGCTVYCIFIWSIFFSGQIDNIFPPILLTVAFIPVYIFIHYIFLKSKLLTTFKVRNQRFKLNIRYKNKDIVVEDHLSALGVYCRPIYYYKNTSVLAVFLNYNNQTYMLPIKSTQYAYSIYSFLCHQKGVHPISAEQFGNFSGLTEILPLDAIMKKYPCRK